MCSLFLIVFGVDCSSAVASVCLVFSSNKWQTFLFAQTLFIPMCPALLKVLFHPKIPGAPNSHIR